MDPVISALGVVSAAGIGQGAFSDALRAGESCIRPGIIPSFSSDPVPLGQCLDLPSRLGEDRALTLARAAMAECVEGVGDGVIRKNPRRVGLVIGTTCGGTLSLEAALGDDGVLGAGTPSDIPFDAVTRHLAQEFGIRGPTRTLTVACASGTQVFEVARGLLRSGDVDGVFVGGVDTVSGFILKGFKALRGLGRMPYAVFEGGGSPGGGVILGEGAAICYMEARGVALDARRPILGTVLGCFGGNEGHALTRPRADGEGIARCLRRALEDAALREGDIDHLSLHGTGTRAGDEAEYRALGQVFGGRVNQLGFSAIKPIIGHTSGAAGALEVGALLLASQGGFRPALARAGEMALPIPRGEARPGPIGVAASLGAGFGGSNAALILRCGPGEEGEGRPRRAVLRRGGEIEPWITAVGVAMPGESLVTPALGQWRAGAWLKGLGEVPLSRESQRLDPLSALFMLAAHRCLQGVDVAPDALGLCLASAVGCLESSEAFLKGGRPNPIIFQNTVCNASLAYLSMVTGARGPSLMLTQGSLSGVAALQEGRRLLKEGQCEAVLVVGGDRPPSLALGHLEAEREPSPPEGSIALLLEAPKAARARGARPLGVLAGFTVPTEGELCPADAVLLAITNGLVKVAVSALAHRQRAGAGVGAVASACQGRLEGL